MGVGELLDAAIRLYRAQWKRLMAIVAIVVVPVTFLQGFLTRTLGSPFADPTTVSTDVDSTFIASLVLSALQTFVIYPFLTAAVARASADVYLGHEVTVGPTFRFAARRIHSILWISILSALATGLGLLLLVIPGIIVFVRLVFGSVVLVVEGQKGGKALGRSWRLAKRHFWKLLGTLVLAFVMAGFVQFILAIPGGIAYAAIGTAGWPFLAIATTLAEVITTPFTTLITVLLYFDLRIRKEGFDLEVMAREMSSSQ